MDEDTLQWGMNKVINEFKKSIIRSFSQEVLSFERPKKSNEKLSKHNKQANEILSKKHSEVPRHTLAALYTEGAAHTKYGSIHMADAYINRSACLFDGEMYEESLMDIERVLKMNCRDEDKSTLYGRKAECLFILKKGMCPEVTEALDNARKWFNMMNVSHKSTMKKFLNKFPDDLLTKKLLNKINTSKFISKISEENSVLVGASSAIDLKYTENFGRHIVAARDIVAGETLWVRKSYTSIIHPQSRYKYCWNCSKRAGSGIPCHHCANVIYCNENCRDEAWKEHHDIECPVIHVLLNTTVTKLKSMMALRLAVKAYKEAGTIQKLQKKIHKINTIRDPIQKCLTNNVFDDTKLASIWSMRPHGYSEYEYINHAATVLRVLAATTEVFGKRINTLDELLHNEEALFMGGLIAVFFGINSKNEKMVCKDMDNGVEHCSKLYPFMTMFNHSCDPMVMNYISGDVSSLITLQRFKKGEQIYLNYGPTFFNTETAQRRASIQRAFGFECGCIPCQSKWGPDTVSSFPSHQITYSTELQESLDYIEKKYPDEEKKCSAVLKHKYLIISKIIDVINIHQRKRGYPTKEIMDMKKLLVKLYRSIG